MRKLFFIGLALLIASPLFAQEDYLKLQNEIDEWILSATAEQKIPEYETPVVMTHPEFGYSIVGFFKRGILQYSTSVVICGPKNSFKLSGVVAGSEYIKGVKEEADGTSTYGIFKVSNFQDGGIISKVRKAGELLISEADIQYYKGYYNDCPAILSVRQKCIAVDGKTGKRGYVGLRCPITGANIISVGYKNLKELLLTADRGCRIEYDNGYEFLGRLQPILLESGYVGFRRLEGVNKNTPDGFVEESVKRDGKFVKMLRFYKPDNNVVSEELIVPTSLISDENLWNTKMYYLNAEGICYKYRDGSSYSGKFEVDIVDSADGKMSSIKVKSTEGTYTYSNGDIFVGNMSGLYYWGVPIDGLTKFKDGTSARGNWLLKYDLTQEQLDSLASKKNPTEIRKQAEKYQFSNTYIKYKTWRVEYFSPESEEVESVYLDDEVLLYVKKAGWFRGINKGETQLDFWVDDHGRRGEEIIYSNGRPRYINQYAWYSNGEIRSVKSYHFDTKLIYLSINFFSDGSFKNAYQYEKGNDGETILRKSKEAHPTYGGFITKQYDLDGNYEKTIKWKIGDEPETIWGVLRYDFIPDEVNVKYLEQIK